MSWFTSFAGRVSEKITMGTKFRWPCKSCNDWCLHSILNTKLEAWGHFRGMMRESHISFNTPIPWDFDPSRFADLAHQSSPVCFFTLHCLPTAGWGFNHIFCSCFYQFLTVVTIKHRDIIQKSCLVDDLFVGWLHLVATLANPKVSSLPGSTVYHRSKVGFPSISHFLDDVSISQNFPSIPPLCPLHPSS